MAGRRSTTKRNKTPTQKRRVAIETKDVENTEPVTIETPLDVATDDIDRPDLAMVTDSDMETPEVKEYARDLAFMNDILTISVGASSDENAENPVPAGVNGEIRLFVRGEEYKVERKFVDSIIKRENNVKTVQFKDNDGCDQTKIETTPTMKYPILIHNDPAGETGRRWFKHACANAF
jgi:hypothetical protein